MKQWYEENPKLLEGEKMAMNKFFPDFKLEKLDDGCLYWIGELSPGIYETKFGVKKTYIVMVAYNNNHPELEMGSSVRIYPILPDVHDLIDECGFRPYRFLVDSSDDLLLCDNGCFSRSIYTACDALNFAQTWFADLEMVLIGELTESDFNSKFR